MSIFETIILGVIEGLTEFLPISSTGHMILVSSWLGIQEDVFVNTFQISIQIGAIMAIVMLYAPRFITNFKMYWKLLIAFIPTAVIGFLAYSTIKEFLFNPIVVSVALIIGGIILILIDKWLVNKEKKYKELDDISFKNSAFIGLMQCLSMIPGTSRAAATIIGGALNGYDKKQATEFSFLLAVPTMIAATGYDLLKTEAVIGQYQLLLLAIGSFVAFISAWIAVKVFLRIVENYGFKHFGYYRIVLGILFLIFMGSSF